MLHLHNHLHITHRRHLHQGDAYVDESLRTEPISERIAALKTLKSLSLFNCGFSGFVFGHNLAASAPLWFSAVPILSKHVVKCPAREPGSRCPLRPLPALFWSLTALEHLDLSSNQFSGEISALVGKLRRLEVPSPRLKSVCIDVPRDLGPCIYPRAHQSLELQVNRFSGPIPAEICDLEGCEILDLSEQVCTRSFLIFELHDYLTHSLSLYLTAQG